MKELDWRVHIKAKSTRGIYTDLVKTHGEESFSVLLNCKKKWEADFIGDKKNTDPDPLSSQPEYAITNHEYTLLRLGSGLFIEVRKGAKIRSRYNQVPHPTQDTNGKVTNSQNPI